MFVTNSSNLQGQFKTPDGIRMLWKSMDLSRCEYSFLIEGMGLEDGGFSPVAHLVTDVETVQMMRAAEQGEFMIVTNIHLILPPTKREQGSYAMELLSEIRIQAGTEENPIYEFITGTGHIYTSSRK